ncbi:hypothetical protein [Streptomyces sp. GESEQ-35]|uniref:hypothetical protein n=1 Tax=Streptomyces sp. GESEQ-35 TaxID=2812657 RepID=UPI001B32CD49|nr:hypothetical protein [Streptomyces sp. GESEQ-35]
MSDDLSTERSAELSTALREFAAEHETPTVLTGAEVRGRAVRRARRRRAGTLAAGAAALALAAFALILDSTGEENQRRLPAATPAVPSPAATSAVPSPAMPVDGVIDLDRRTLTVGARVMAITKGLADSPRLVGPLTVFKRHDIKDPTVAAPTAGARYSAEISLAVELRDANDEPVYVGVALTYVKSDAKYDTRGNWIGLDPTDAKWFYSSVKAGSVLSVTATGS